MNEIAEICLWTLTAWATIEGLAVGFSVAKTAVRNVTRDD